MPRRFAWGEFALDGLFVVLTIAGVVTAWPAQREAARLQSEIAKYERVWGQMEIGDKTRYHVLRIPTDDPLEVCWRAYFPTRNGSGVQMSTGHEYSSTSTSGPQAAGEGLIRLRFTIEENQVKWQLRFRFPEQQSLSGSTMFSKEFATALSRGDLSGLRFVGDGKVETFADDAIVPLVVSDGVEGDPLKPDLRIELGTPAVFGKARAQ